MFIPSQLALDEIDSHTALIVVDTNRPSYTECPNLLNRAKAIVVFDHHRQCEDVVKNAVLSYTEPYASSTCEMIAEVLQYFDEDIKLSTQEADAIYAGILIDTNNFVPKQVSVLLRQQHICAGAEQRLPECARCSGMIWMRTKRERKPCGMQKCSTICLLSACARRTILRADGGVCTGSE